MSTRLQLWCAWAGPAFLVLYLIAFWGIAGFIPPPSPSLTPDQVAAFYDANRTEIRIGQLGGLVASTLLLPFFGLISIQIARIERRAPLLAMVQFGGGGSLAVFFKQGPFAWNGLIGFWMPVTIFALWLCVTTALLVQAAARSAAASTW